jgi:periplasmic protein CpxP/Spy
MKKLLSICCLLIALTSASFAQTKKPGTTDPAEKAKLLQKQLKLNDSQTAKITAIYEESLQKFEKIKKDENGNTNKMLVAVKPLRKATIKKIENVLTPTETLKYKELIKDNKSGSSNGWSDGWSSTAETK